MPEVRGDDKAGRGDGLYRCLAGSPEFHLDMTLEVGDLQFVNNHYIMHSRTAYEDHEDWAEKRHLMRLWLACDDGPTFSAWYDRTLPRPDPEWTAKRHSHTRRPVQRTAGCGVSYTRA